MIGIVQETYCIIKLIYKAPKMPYLMILVWPLQSGNYMSHVIRNIQTYLTEMNHIN